MMGHKIRAVRKWKDITQEQLAEQLNISQPALSKIESNDTPISFEKLTEISEKLDCDINELLNSDAGSVYNNHQSGGYSGMNNVYYTLNPEDLLKIFEKLLEDKNKQIEFLERLLESKK